MKILVTGGTGMIGSAFREIKTPHELILVGSKDFDLAIERRYRCSFEINS